MKIYKNKSFHKRKAEKRQFKNKLNRFFISIMLVVVTAMSVYAIDNEPKETVVVESIALNKSICDTAKCLARVERLEVCGGDVECAVNKTLEASKPYITEEIESLYNIVTTPVKKKTTRDYAIELIKEHEGLALQAYCDTLKPFTRKDGTRGLYRACEGSPSARWSIGFGTISYPGETITAEEAIKRMERELDDNFLPYLSDNCGYTNKQKGAIVDFYYNAGVWAGLKHYVDSCDSASILFVFNPDQYAGGLKDRRNSQRTYFLN